MSNHASVRGPSRPQATLLTRLLAACLAAMGASAPAALADGQTGTPTDQTKEAGASSDAQGDVQDGLSASSPSLAFPGNAETSEVDSTDGSVPAISAGDEASPEGESDADDALSAEEMAELEAALKAEAAQAAADSTSSAATPTDAGQGGIR